MKHLLGKGVYGFPEASRLARVDAHSARRWFLGRADTDSGPVLLSDIPSVGDKHALSFLDLIDLRVVGRLRVMGISMHTIRRVYFKLAEQIDTRHPFAHAKLKVFGKTIMQCVDSEDDGQELREVLTGQKAMHGILKDFLSDVEYSDQSGLATRWLVHRGVMIDPDRNLGKPVSSATGAGTYVLARAYAANDENADLVADLFNTSAKAVLDAVAFEEWLRGGARVAA